jgi:hypothetical protein
VRWAPTPRGDRCRVGTVARCCADSVQSYVGQKLTAAFASRTMGSELRSGLPGLQREMEMEHKQERLTRGSLVIVGRLLSQEQVPADELERWLLGSADAISEEFGAEVYAELAFVDLSSKRWRRDARAVLQDGLSATVRTAAIDAAERSLSDVFGLAVRANLEAVERHGADAEQELAAIYRQYCDGAKVLRSIAEGWGLHCEITAQEREWPSPQPGAPEAPRTDPRVLAREAMATIAKRSLSYRVNRECQPGASRFREVAS